ncbi:MAG: MaoC family dehydratase [Candidatus Aminicenantes bacterium]|nr:MaoC family dehydratase [Candidatus Aminicenantes bacterium]
MPERLTPRKLKAFVDKEIGVSDWFVVGQERIDAFAECTEDRQWIHVDPEKAAKSRLGGTVAHGFLMLSLLPHFLKVIPLLQMKYKMAANYGLDKVRFITPVPSGARVRNRAVLREIRKRGFRKILLKIENYLEIEGNEEPAVLAELLVLVYL